MRVKMYNFYFYLGSEPHPTSTEHVKYLGKKIIMKMYVNFLKIS